MKGFDITLNDKQKNDPKTLSDIELYLVIKKYRQCILFV